MVPSPTKRRTRDHRNVTAKKNHYQILRTAAGLNVNLMAGNLTAQVRNIVAVTTAVAKGDLSKKITVDVRGEILELKDTINTMVDQLSSFASEVTRVAREVGTE